MAGAGYKLFNTGDVLTAAQVNTYLMEQTVMVFADAAARTTALTGVVAEGMLSYLKSTKQVEVFNGTSWVASDDPNAIQNTIVDAKGDLITATAADTPARLAVGSNGDTLVADSAASVGLRYQPGNGLAQGFINGAMEIWQRGTSFTITSGTAYTADRWMGRNLGTNVTYSRQTSGLNGFQYCMRVQRPNGLTGTNGLYLYYNSETADTYRFAGKTVTISFYARKGTNFSGASSAIGFDIYTGTGTDQNIGISGFTGQTYAGGIGAVLTSSWQRFSGTVTFGSTTTQFGIVAGYAPVGTAGADDYFEITGVQLEEGSVATTFRRSGGTIQGELAACQRYYRIVSTAPGVGAGTTTCQISVPYAGMRTTPTVAVSAALTITDCVASDFTQSSGTITISDSDANGARFNIANFTGLTTYRPYLFITSGGEIQLSAEL